MFVSGRDRPTWPRSAAALACAALACALLPAQSAAALSRAEQSAPGESVSAWVRDLSGAQVTGGVTSSPVAGEAAGKAASAESGAVSSGQEFAETDVQAAPEWVAGLRAAQEASQLILVAADGTSTATLTLYERTDSAWIQVLETSAFIGRNGIGKMREGDGKTPTGQYSFAMAFGTSADPGTSLPYLQVDSSWYWVDDVNSLYYNRLVSTQTVTPDWTSAEHLSDYTKSYAYALALDYNSDCVPGAGSAIFLHCADGSATSGCIAVSQDAMLTILQRLRPDCRILIDYADNLHSY